MKFTKEIIHSFIVRIWIEPREMTDAEPIWRGVIEHVEDNERVYFDQLDKISIYLSKYLRKIGIRSENKENK